MKDSRRFLLLMKVVLILLIILSQKGVAFALCDVVRTCVVLSFDAVLVLSRMTLLVGKLVFGFLVDLGMIVRACMVLSHAVIQALGQMFFLLGKLVFWALVGLGMVVNYGLKYGLWILFDMAFKITHA